MPDASYDLERLKRELSRDGIALVYKAETGSTMDDAVAQSFTPSVVVTDHQLAGRGRYDRVWRDTFGSSILMTLVRRVSLAAASADFPLRLSHCFVLAVREVLGSPAIKIRWPNDLIIEDRKLGGVLLIEGERTATHAATSFGIGLNIFGARDSEVSYVSSVLPDPNRTDLVLAISRTLDLFLADMTRLSDLDVALHYGTLWREASGMIGRRVRLTEVINGQTHTIEGTVVDSPFGGYLKLQLSNGDIITMKEYAHTAHLELVG